MLRRLTVNPVFHFLYLHSNLTLVTMSHRLLTTYAKRECLYVSRRPRNCDIGRVSRFQSKTNLQPPLLIQAGDVVLLRHTQERPLPRARRSSHQTKTQSHFTDKVHYLYLFVCTYSLFISYILHQNAQINSNLPDSQTKPHCLKHFNTHLSVFYAKINHQLVSTGSLSHWPRCRKLIEGFGGDHSKRQQQPSEGVGGPKSLERCLQLQLHNMHCVISKSI